jgi:hypothetical protein
LKFKNRLWAANFPLVESALFQARRLDEECEGEKMFMRLDKRVVKEKISDRGWM